MWVSNTPKFCVQLAPLHTPHTPFFPAEMSCFAGTAARVAGRGHVWAQSEAYLASSHIHFSLDWHPVSMHHIFIRLLNIFDRKSHVCELECYAAIPWPSVFSQSVKRLRRPAGFAATPSWRRHAMGFRDWVASETWSETETLKHYETLFIKHIN